MPSANASKRYVASIKIERVISDPGTGRGDDKRHIEGTNVIVRSDTFEGLKSKVQAHLGLIDDEDFGDERLLR